MLDVVIGESTTALQFFTVEGYLRLVSGKAFLVLDLGLDVVYGVGSLHLQGEGFSGWGFQEYLHRSLNLIHLCILPQPDTPQVILVFLLYLAPKPSVIFNLIVEDVLREWNRSPSKSWNQPHFEIVNVVLQKSWNRPHFEIVNVVLQRL